MAKRPALRTNISLYDDDDDGPASDEKKMARLRDDADGSTSAKRVNFSAAKSDESGGEQHNEESGNRKPASGESSPPLKQSTERTFIPVAVGRKGERDEMQDRHHFEENFQIGVNTSADIRRFAFFGLFDGHAGCKAAEFCAENFAKRLAATCAKYAQAGDKILVSMEKAMKKIFIETYKSIDDAFLVEARKRRPILKDGSTATTLLLLNDVLYCANIGDSRAVVCRRKADSVDPIVLQLTVDHSPLDFNERMRIQKAGGMVKDGRIMGVLEVSRSIGDGQFKAHGLSCIPDVKKITITSEDFFVLLACDGLWKTFSSEEAVRFALSKYDELRNDAKFLAIMNAEVRESASTVANDTLETLRLSHVWTKVADELCKTAVLRGSGDNVSIILIVFTENLDVHSSPVTASNSI